MAQHALFITGTDTGVGKTTVACGLAAALRRRGLRVGVLKPAETGCAPGPDGRLVAEDAHRLGFFAETLSDGDSVCPYRFSEPLAPAVAAHRAGLVIDPNVLVAAFREIASESDVVLVEGAGGLLVPLSEALTFADLAHLFGLPLLLVVGNRLGAVNHALLTAECARMRGLRLAGYVVNEIGAASDLAVETNVHTLERWLGPSLGHVPFLGRVEPEPGERRRLAEVVERAVAVEDLLRAAELPERPQKG